MPKAKTNACPAVPAALLEWLDRMFPEPRFDADPLKNAHAMGKRAVVVALRHQYEAQNKKAESVAHVRS